MGWLMLTERNVQKYYPKATEMAKGHLHQTRNNIHSPPKKNLPHAKHATPCYSMARKYAMSTPKRTRYAIPCSPTKQASSRCVCNKATNISW